MPMNAQRILAVLLACALGAAWPATALAQKVGTSSLQFLKVMPTARATALGDAYSALASGADAVFWNPAGITGAASHDIALTLTLWIFDSRQAALAYSVPLGEIGSLGLQLQYVDYGEIEETRVDQLEFVGTGGDMRYNPGLTGNVFSPSALVAGLTYAKDLTERFSTGLTVKFVHESLYSSGTVTVPDEAGGYDTYNTAVSLFLFDFGMRYRTGFRSMILGASVQNFGSQVKYGEEGYPAPLAFRLGLSFNVFGSDGLAWVDEQNRLTMAFDIFQPNDYAQQLHVGAEYCFADAFALRGGYKWNYDTEGLTLGAGVRTQLTGVDLRFDYSFGDLGEFLSTVHRLSLGVTLP